MSEDKAEYDITRAQAVIEAERQARAERCAQRIAAILEEERCQLAAFLQFAEDGRVVATVRIVAVNNALPPR